MGLRLHRRKHRRGFTLMEVMVVVVLVGILAVIAVPMYNRYIQRTRASEARAMIAAIVTAEKAYAERNGAFVSAADPQDFLERLRIDVEESDHFSYEVLDVGGKDRFRLRATVNAYGARQGLPPEGTVAVECRYDRTSDPRFQCVENL